MRSSNNYHYYTQPVDAQTLAEAAKHVRARQERERRESHEIQEDSEKRRDLNATRILEAKCRNIVFEVRGIRRVLTYYSQRSTFFFFFLFALVFSC
ncbi:unnamed protein product [Haemonchus placei]|uniref:IBB domain-containing protein n=1 Tax=Haemonchus placei TaxID=6290 RepID=A0A0N4VS12_HAEPC|nr:unnamed protein product [Haemonchus placei]